jgi:hypothetical protein
MLHALVDMRNMQVTLGAEAAIDAEHGMDLNVCVEREETVLKVRTRAVPFASKT